MKKLYIIGASIVFIFILILALPEIGSSCQFYGPLKRSGCTPALFQISGLGAVLGGLLILLWKAPPEKKDTDDEDDGEDSLNE